MRWKSTKPCLVSLRRTGTGRCFIEIEVKSLSFVVVGAGRLGASLARALQARGPTLLGYSARTPAGRARADRWLGGSAAHSLDDLVSLRPQLYLLAVPDADVTDVATRLGPLLRPDDNPLVAHTSGATSINALAICAGAGATTFVFHPLQTFPDPFAAADRFSGAAVAVTPAEAVDQAESSPGFALARLLGAKPFLLADRDRALYHAAAAMACNYFVTLEHLAKDLFVKAGLPAQDALSMFLPLVKTTLANVESQGTINALTGPFVRGDTGTVLSHLAAISQDAGEVDPVYRTLGLATLALVRERKEITDDTIEEMAGLLRAPLGTLIATPD